MTVPAFRRLSAARNATATVEFALILPILLAFVGGLVDFGFAFSAQCALATAVSAGSQYAFSQGQLTQTAVPSDVRTKVQNALNLAGASVPLPTLSLNCVVRNTAATPPTTTLSATMTAGASCPSGNLPGTYVIIQASYTYVPIMPFYSQLASTTLQETAYVRLF